MPLGMHEEGLGMGTLLAGAASAAFVAYIAYKISKKREEIRDTIELLNDDHASFVDDLESLVTTGAVTPIID